MKVRLIRAEQLERPETERWTEIQDSSPELASPFFSPFFTKAVGSVLQDSFVAIIEGDGGIQGFFPFQLRGKGIGKPIGWPLSDYQGLIAENGVPCDVAGLLRACRLQVFDFDHLLVTQRAFEAHHLAVADSPYLDLKHGYERYAEEREKAGSKIVNARMGTKWRKLEREVGPLRFVLHDESDSAFETLLAWKSDQYRRTNAIDLFRYDWPVRLLETIRHLREAGFEGLLSSLYAGDQLLAVHLGMRSRSIWHYWFPAYGVAFNKYSAGYRLLIEMAKAAPGLGIDMIDLGRGDTSYKQRLGSHVIPVARGFVARPSIARTKRATWRWLGRLVEQLPPSFANDVPRRAYRRIEARARRP